MSDTPTAARANTRASVRAAALVLLIALAPLAEAQTRPGDKQRALTIAQMVDQLQRDGRLSDAAKLLDVALDELRAGPELTAMLLIRRAESRRVLFELEGLREDLSRAETLLQGTLDEQLMLCNIHGIRGDVALDQGLLAEAAASFARERELVEQERASRGATPLEWFHANSRACRLMLAREDYLDLVQSVEAWLKDPAYTGPAHETEAAQLRLRLALGLRELEQNEPGTTPTAEAMLREITDEVPPSDRPVALLRLAELRLREDDTSAARDWLQQAAGLLQRSSGDLTETLQAEPLLLAALQARTERLAGSDTQILAERTAAIDDQLARFRRNWAARPLREGGYGPLQFGPILTLLGERIELHLLAGETEEALAAALGELMRVAALGSLARFLHAPVPTLDVIRKEVLGDDPGHGVLIYLPTAWATHLFLVDSTTLRHLELARDDVIEDTRRALARQLFRGPGASDDRARHEQRALCAELAGLLLPDGFWSTAASWQRLSIVGTDVLGEVPFEMLPTKDGVPLGQRFAVDRLPSLPVAVALSRQHSSLPAAGTVTLLVANDPSAQALTLAPGLPTLPLDETRAAALLAAYPDAAQVVLCGDRARFDRLARASGALPPRVWQLIAHGVADNTGELGVGLALAPGDTLPDGMLWVEQARQASPPPLVILTACRAGAAPLRRGDPGAADLAGAFLAAGAQAVIVSPYELELNAVLRLSTALHQALAQGASPAEALRRARVSLAEDAGSSPGPQATSAARLQVVGLGQLPILTPVPTNLRPWWFAAGALALAALATATLISRMGREA